MTDVVPPQGASAASSEAKQPKATKSLTYRLVQLGDGVFDYMQDAGQIITFKSEEHRKRWLANLSKGAIGGIDLAVERHEASTERANPLESILIDLAVHVELAKGNQPTIDSAIDSAREAIRQTILSSLPRKPDLTMMYSWHDGQVRSAVSQTLTEVVDTINKLFDEV